MHTYTYTHIRSLIHLCTYTYLHTMYVAFFYMTGPRVIHFTTFFLFFPFFFIFKTVHVLRLCKSECKYMFAYGCIRVYTDQQNPTD